jgi:uncharacterized membrane protein
MQGSLLKAKARQLIFKNAPMLFFISLLYVVLAAVISWLAFRLPGSINPQNMYDRLASGELLSIFMIYTNFRPIGVFFAILLFLLHPILDVGFMSYCLKINRGKKNDYKDLFNGFIIFGKIISIFIISSFFIFLWSLLLIIPGLVAAYRYRQAYYILLDDPKKSAIQCITESKLMMYGYKVDLFAIDFSFLGWYILDTAVILFIPIPFLIPIVSVWLSPYIGLTRAAFYENRVADVAV